jgi:signal transduction histidine kinase
MLASTALQSRHRSTIFIVFVAGIILPSAFLGYLGLRSFHYEGMVMQKQAEEHYAASADLIEKKIGEKLAAYVSLLHDLSRAPAVQARQTPELMSLALKTSKLGELPIENLFVMSESSQMLAPWPSSFSASRENLRPADLDWGALRDEIDRLDHLEFIEKNVSQAVKGYEALQSESLPPAQQATLLKNLASGYRKLHRDAEAESAYLKLVREFGERPDSSGYPMGVLAEQLLIDLYEGQNAGEKALNARFVLFEGVLLGRWNVSATQREALLREMQKGIDRKMSAGSDKNAEDRTRWGRLQALRDKLSSVKTASEFFLKKEWPDLLARLRRRGWTEEGGALQLPGEKIGVVAPVYSAKDDRREGFLIAVIPANALWSQLEQSMLELARPVGLSISSSMFPRTPKPAKSWTGTISRKISAIDPPLDFQLADVNAPSRDLFARRRRMIFGGMVGLSFLVIIVGLLVMGQAVKRETEVANLKSEFVANVSHELRTPLAAISHIGERLSLGRYRSEAEQKEFYGMLGRETRRLRELIEDILDFSRMLAGKKVYRQDPVDMVALAQEAQECFEGKALARGFHLDVHLLTADAGIRGDWKALLQAVLNLLDNALKYSGDSRRIEMSLLRMKEQVVVAVKDYGIGIPESEKERIFEKFYRGGHGMVADKEGGVGLGLAMVKHVVEGHGGHVRFESAIGQGSTFSLELPLARKEL